MEQRTYKDKKSILYLISTPIGNLGDISYRTVEILKTVSLILAEDTRTTGILLKKYNIVTPMISFHMHNESDRSDEVIQRMKEGDIALVSDAGTPLISDPGQLLVEKVIEAGYSVTAIPGASALLTALVPSAIQVQPFVFIGFLPRKKQEQMILLRQYDYRKETLIFYESPHRVQKTCQALLEVLGNRQITIARELTKIYETFIRTTLKQVVDIELPLKGEYVLVVGGSSKQNIGDNSLSVYDHVSMLIKQGLDEKTAMKEVALLKGISKKEVYQIYKIDKT